MVVGLLGTFAINTVILPILLYIYVSSSLRKYICIYDDCNIEDILWDRKILTVSVIYKCKRYEYYL